MKAGQAYIGTSKAGKIAAIQRRTKLYEIHIQNIGDIKLNKPK